MSISIAVIDDHTILRETLVEALSKEDDFEVVGHWGEAEDAIRYLKKNKVDVAVVDHILPGISGIEAAREMKKMSTDIKIIILSMFHEEDKILSALEVGVMGYLDKEVAISELKASIRKVFDDKMVVNQNLINGFMRLFKEDTSGGEEEETLTDEHIQVLKLTSRGLSNKEIAKKMDLTVGKIKSRFREIFNILGARDRTNAVVKAIKRGYCSVEDCLGEAHEA